MCTLMEQILNYPNILDNIRNFQLYHKYPQTLPRVLYPINIRRNVFYQRIIKMNPREVNGSKNTQRFEQGFRNNNPMQRIFFWKNHTPQPPAHISCSIDAEMVVEESRFKYEPKNFFNRLFTSLGVSSRLASSRLVHIKYRGWCRWFLVAILALITIFLTPQLVPQWLGFKWSRASDICENPDAKLDFLRQNMEQMTHLPAGIQFVNKANQTVNCMQDGARGFWNGNGRVSYPNECIALNAVANTTSKEVCFGGEKKEDCFTVFVEICHDMTIPKKCTTVSGTDPGSERRVAQLVSQQRQFERMSFLNSTNLKNSREIKETADKASERIIRNVIGQIDFASNLYIVYTMGAIIVGAPVIIFKRERTSALISFAFGMKKAHFVMFVVIILSCFDAGVKIISDADFRRLYRNFLNDPCYLDPTFSRKRVNLIRNTCGKVSVLRANLDDHIMEMTRTSYDAQLCEVSKVRDRGQTANPALLDSIENQRMMFMHGNSSGYKFPAVCNSTHLDQATSTAPERHVNWFEAIFGSGIIAQMFLKGILVSFVTNLIGYLEPMTIHRGVVEIFGMKNQSDDNRHTDREDTSPEDEELSEEEQNSVRSFARDKHLLPLIISSMLVVWEIAVISYSFYLNKNGGSSPFERANAIPVAPSVNNYACSNGQLLLGNLTEQAVTAIIDQ